MGGVAPVVLCGWGGLSETLAIETTAPRRRRWAYDAVWPYYDAAAFGISRLPTGAAAAAFLLDQLIACGARVFVTVGIGGSLAPEVVPGTVMVAGKAIAGDGISPYYSPSPGKPLAALPGLAGDLAAALAEGGVDARIGTTWTTDTPFEEAPEALAAARSRGGLTVDMETAAVYALAAHRGVAACSVLVATDEVWERSDPAFGPLTIRRELDDVCRALPEAVAKAAETGRAAAARLPWRGSLRPRPSGRKESAGLLPAPDTEPAGEPRILLRDQA